MSGWQLSTGHVCGYGEGHVVPAGQPIRHVVGCVWRCAAHSTVPVALDVRETAEAMAAAAARLREIARTRKAERAHGFVPIGRLPKPFAAVADHPAVRRTTEDA